MIVGLGSPKSIGQASRLDGHSVRSCGCNPRSEFVGQVSRLDGHSVRSCGCNPRSEFVGQVSRLETQSGLPMFQS